MAGVLSIEVEEEGGEREREGYCCVLFVGYVSLTVAKDTHILYQSE